MKSIKNLLKSIIIAVVICTTLFGCTSKEDQALDAIKELSQESLLPDNYYEFYKDLFKNADAKQKEESIDMILDVYDIYKECKKEYGSGYQSAFEVKLYSYMLNHTTDSDLLEGLEPEENKDPVKEEKDYNNSNKVSNDYNNTNGQTDYIVGDLFMSYTYDDAMTGDQSIVCLGFVKDENSLYVPSMNWKDFVYCGDDFTIVNGKDSKSHSGHAIYNLDSWMTQVSDEIYNGIIAGSYAIEITCSNCGDVGYCEDGTALNNKVTCTKCNSDKLYATCPGLDEIYKCHIKIDLNANQQDDSAWAVSADSEMIVK